MNTHCTLIIFLGFLVTSQSLAVAEDEPYAVVVNAANTSELSSQDVLRLFLGKRMMYSVGKRALPLMQDPESEIGKTFLKKLLRKQPVQYKRYWMSMIFTGKGHPPKVYSEEHKLVEAIAKDPRAIGIIKRSSVDKRFRVITTF